jgi:hypothetical protein
MIHIARTHLRASLCLLASLVCLLLVACNKEQARFVDHPRLTSAVTMHNVTFYSASLQRQMP